MLRSPAIVEETQHGRDRRLQRGIDKKLDLDTVLAYGKQIKCRYGLKFQYKDIVYAVKQQGLTNKFKEVTCYALPVPLKKVKVTREMVDSYLVAEEQLKQNLHKWKSNTVIVVDTSGSMRKADVWGTRSRLHAVWLSIALDFIAHRIETGQGGLHDAVTIISLGDCAEILTETKPTSWVLYNDLVDIYQGSRAKQVSARGHGFYVPSLKAAEEQLNRNKNASCALALCFISDGKPSDHGGSDQHAILESVETLSKSFGRRLTFTAVGIGSDVKEFSMLQTMVSTAKDYGVQAFFELPSMTSAALGDVLTLTATSLTKTQTEMTDLGSIKQRSVRDVQRESRSKAYNEKVESVSKEEYWLYPASKVERHVFRYSYDNSGRRHEIYDIVPMKNEDAGFVALNKASFGEGAERFAFRFFEVAKDGTTVVGKPLVAKESRLVLEGGEEKRQTFVRTFCQTQQLARRVAEEFNRKLNGLHRVSAATPRVTFLDCSVYVLDDNKQGQQSVLVEEMLDAES